MDVLARFALPGILALSAIGALIVGVLLLRYGSVAPEEEDVDDVEHRVTVTRLAHAFVATCLAGIAVLAAAALVARPAASARSALAGLTPAGPGTPAPPDARPDTREAAETPPIPAASAGSPPAPDASAGSAERPDAAEPAPAARAEAPGNGAAGSGDAPATGRETATTAPQRSTTPSPRMPAAAPPGPAQRESPAREDEVRRLREQVAALEERLDRREAASRAPAVSAPAEPSAELPARTAPPRSTSPRRAEPSATAAATVENGAAPSVTVGKPQITTTIQGVRVDIHRQPGSDADTIYTIHLAAPGNRPLTGADVSLLGRGRDGLPVRAALVPAGEPGSYRARVAAQSAADLRLRVVHASARFEVSLDHPVRW